MFSKSDIQQIKDKNIDINIIKKQIENFKNGFPFVTLVQAATKQNSIISFNKTEIDNLINYYSKKSIKRQVLKFVPCSGAATRMFKNLLAFVNDFKNTDTVFYDDFFEDKSFYSVYYFFKNIKKFAFFDDLKNMMSKAGYDILECIDSKKYILILEYLLTDKGLNYSNLPKALLKFHVYNDGNRMSVEEHLVEGAAYCPDKNKNVRIHFTVSPEHKKAFIKAINTVKIKYQKMFSVKYDIDYSIQKPSTDTIAVDLNNEPFRNDDGTLLFRPGGHGALIENLNDLKGDIVFIKNIDNVVPDKYKSPTYRYKKLIGGYLLKLQEKIFNYLEILENPVVNDEDIMQIIDFAKNSLYIEISDDFYKLQRNKKIDYLYNKLNRPIRVCGMVKNQGEPGGGPFLTKNSSGNVSLQIVETSQIDLNNPEQKNILKNSTHFNPVDLVCGLRNFKGDNFNLKNFVDSEAGFISIKSKNGKSLKAQELPGLWNGAMADWITIFVEVPIITFNPVKVINDLLREEHQ